MQVTIVTGSGNGVSLTAAAIRSRCRIVRSAALATAAMCLTTSLASAATFNDEAAGAWNSAATWGGSVPTSSADIVTIDQYVVTATLGGSGTFTGGEVHLDSSGRLNITNRDQSASVPLNLYLNGGTFGTGNNNVFAGGVSGTHQIISVSGTSYIVGSSSETAIIGSSSRQTYLTGSGTLVKSGGGTLTFEGSAAATTNLSDFSGTLRVDAGTVTVNHVNILKNASVVLGGAATKLNLPFGSQFATVGEPIVKNLYGTGTITWGGSSANSYGRDLSIGDGGVLSPGTASATGTISRDMVSNRNELIFKPNSTLEMDIFGPAEADADKVVWTDAANVSTVDIRNASLKVRLFTPTQNLALTSWTLMDVDQFGIAKGIANEIAARSTSMTFAADGISFLNALGSGPAAAGWKDLAITYDYTDGAAKVILTGRFEVPEPGTVSLFAAAIGAGLLRRRRCSRGPCG